LKKLLVLVLLLAGCGYAGSQGYDWVNYQVQAPMSARPQAVTIHIDEGESPDQIAQDLKDKGLIRNKDVFVYYMRYTGARSHLQAGDFVLNRNMNMAQITDVLQHGKPSQVAVRLPEGYTLQQMAAEAEKDGLGKASSYVAASNDSAWDYPFLKDRPAKTNLEGFLFPDTYLLDRSAGPRDLVKKQLDRFDQVFSPDLRAQAAQATPSRPAESIYNIVILASIVEREVNREPDRPRACSVYYNRLVDGTPLQVDATVLYAEGKTAGQPDTAFDSPYNTYLHKGLPPGPISNPGLSAIKACLNPDKTDFMFYFTDPKGVTHFQQTAAEFEQQKSQYGVAH
jgi:UPF0755 protein